MAAHEPGHMADPSKPRDVSAYRASTYIQVHLFLGATVWALTIWQWPWRWLLSGSPVLTYTLWLGEALGYRVLPFVPLWTIITFINLTYAVATTSWLLFGFFLPSCYLAIFVSCLCQFETISNFVRSTLGSIVEQLHFVNDQIAFFNIPALEIDTEVGGLMVIRGLTFSLLHLSVVAHGIEVGIKLSDDIELALQVDEVQIKLFRRIDVGDVFGNVKGGEYEMTFGSLADSNKTTTDDASFMVADTPLLLAARMGNKGPEIVSTSDKLTNGEAPVAVSAGDAAASLTQINPTKDKARSRYSDALKQIDKTSVIREAREQVDKLAEQASKVETRNFDTSDPRDMRAAICSELHDRPSVPHPPTSSVKVTTLQNLTPPKVRRFMHRLPFLLRLLLNPIAYFHTIHIGSVTVGGSGKWLRHMLHELVFKDHDMRDAGVANLERRLSAWLSDANFVVQLAKIFGAAQVPLSTSFDVTTQIRVDDIMVYRTLPTKVDLKQVVRLGGADAAITVPSFLLPHHEHILPPEPTQEMQENTAAEVDEADNRSPEQRRAEPKLEEMVKDETNLTLSVHARLPAVFDQELLNFIAALIKATKLIEMDQVQHQDSSDHIEEHIEEHIDEPIDEPASDTEPASPRKRRTFMEMTKTLSSDIAKGTKSLSGDIAKGTKTLQSDIAKGMRRVAVDAVTNDRWIAKLVGKSIRRLENARGDVGYSGLVPISLAPYRKLAEDDIKLLP